MELIFIHIPKTCGRSFAAALNHVYGKEFNAYKPLGIRPEGDTLLYTDYDARKASWDQAMERLPGQINWLTDHMPIQLFDDLLPGVPRVTWLRDPVRRVVSAYIHETVHGIVEPCGIRDFIARDKKRNVMTFFTAGGDLDRFFFVGIAEQFDRSLARLAERLGWPSYPVVHDNKCVAPGLKEILLSNRALVSEIERLNQQDCELYTRALRNTKEG